MVALLRRHRLESWLVCLIHAIAVAIQLIDLAVTGHTTTTGATMVRVTMIDVRRHRVWCCWSGWVGSRDNNGRFGVE